MGRDELNTFECETLAVLASHPNNAYGTTLRKWLGERMGREPSIGGLYTTLDRLEAKGFVSSWWGEATPERGGRRKRFYKIEATGQQALRRAGDRVQRWASYGPILSGA
jgi:PadR family transcriptional regulator, regulatory protein PadR